MNTDRPAGPSEALRTAINVALFVHIVAVLILTAARTGVTEGTSALQRRLRASAPGVRQYGQLLHNDLGYNYSLTQALPSDDDHRIEVELQLSDGSTKSWILPQPGDPHWLRRTRYRSLALIAGNEGEPNDSIIPTAVARRLVAETGAQAGTIRIRAHAPQSPRDVESSDRSLADPWNARFFTTVYEAQVLVDGSDVQPLKRAENAVDTAPAMRRGRGPEATP